jgi:hypothetical protein
LKWIELAFRLVHDPVGRAPTEIDNKNAREAAQIMREAVPLLEKILDGHHSERLRRKAQQYLAFIATPLKSKADGRAR